MPKKKNISLEEGEGLEALKRQAGVYPPSVRNMLKKIGNEKITSLKIVRTPLSGFVRTLLNVISLGAYQRALRESPYDSMFHLALLINGKYTTDKQSVITLTQSNPIKSNSDTMDVSVQGELTIQQLLDNGREYMGAEKFSNYDARTNNCQDYILGLLRGSKLWTQDLENFIKQDAEVIYKKLPTLTQKIASFLTDVGAVADRVTEGEGTKKKKPCWKGYEMIGMKEKNGKQVPNCVPISTEGTGMDFKEQWIEIGTGMYQFPINEKIVLKIEKPLTGGSFKLYKQSDDCYTLMNIETGKVHGYCMTEENAKQQLGLLQRVQNEEVAKRIVVSDLDKKQKKIKTINNKKKKTMESWREYYAKHTKGKKFASRAEVNAHMKQLSAEYKAMKSKSS